MFRSLAAAGVAAVLVSSGPASALESATTTDLNLRSGPGPNYAVTGVIPGGTAVDVAGCIEAANWCQVSYNGQTGWSYGDYLTTAVGSEPVYLTVDRARTQVRTIVYDDTGEQSAAIVGSMGAVAGALIAGPGGAAVGAVSGAAAGGMADPGETVTTYVTANPVDYVFLDGEVVAGAGVPETVVLYPVPESQYSYAYINGVPVVINPVDRRVVRIVR
ncbi:DUF1236 domain-containing protein [Albidovulum sp.]|jgi:uncharacterized protein YraI|uniref:DUF1236 domain-containing protein n=1 Tax=Albidovulum sp. TaxID=1872424 RepID=UPI00306FBA33